MYLPDQLNNPYFLAVALLVFLALYPVSLSKIDDSAKWHQVLKMQPLQ